MGKASVGSISGSHFVTASSPLELPVRVRRVRDSGSLFFMLAFLGFLAYIVWDAIYVKQVDVNLIVHGYDSYGNICGRNNKPIRFAEKSGRNYTDQPYTKYTLIDAQFERYTLDTSRARFGELVYVKESEQAARIRQDHGRPAKHQERLAALLQSQSQQQRRWSAAVSTSTPPLYFSGPVNLNRAQLNQFKFVSAAAMTSRGQPNSSNPADPTTSSHSQTGITSAPANEADQYEHMLVTPIVGGSPTNNRPATPPSPMTGARPRPPMGQDKLAGQLLYLTECVSSCPSEHVELVFYRCLPNNWRLSLFPNAINVTRTFIDDILTDMSHCYRELIYTFSLALVLSLLLLILLRFLAGLIIWSCLALLIAIFVAMAAYSWLTFYQHLMDLSQLQHLHLSGAHDSIFSERLVASDRWLIGSILLTFVAFAAIATVLFMRKRILLVTMLFRESGKAIADMPLLLLQPLFTFGALLAILMGWLAALVCLQSAKEPHVDLASSFVVFKSETLYKVMKWYHMFAFLWVSHFAIACQHYVIGASVSKWYFSANRYALSSPIGTSIAELILYYLGSVALGSFLVAVFKVLRLITRQMQFLIQRSCISAPATNAAHPQPLVDQSPAPSSLFGSLGYVWRLFIWFFDNLVIIINRDAYVEIAIHGHSFLSGARRAFTVLAANPLRLLAIKSVGNILLVIAKICVVLGTVAMAHLLLQEKSQQLNYAWSPVVISAVYAYTVAHWFLSVYEMVIDALFICYCEDYELAKGVSGETAVSQEQPQQLNGSHFMTQILKSGQIY